MGQSCGNKDIDIKLFVKDADGLVSTNNSVETLTLGPPVADGWAVQLGGNSIQYNHKTSITNSGSGTLTYESKFIITVNGGVAQPSTLPFGSGAIPGGTKITLLSGREITVTGTYEAPLLTFLNVGNYTITRELRVTDSNSLISETHTLLNSINLTSLVVDLVMTEQASGSDIRIDARNSVLAGPTPVTITSSTILRYSWYYGATELFTAEIAANATATSIGSWTYLSGTKSAVLFEEQVVDQIRAGGKGANFIWSELLMAIIDGGGQPLDVTLYINDGFEDDSDTESRTTTTPVAAWTADTTTSGAFDFYQQITAPATVVVDWGDSTIESFSVSTGNVQYTHTYAAGTKSFSVYTYGPLVDRIEVNGRNMTNTLDVSECVNLRFLDAYTNTLTSVDIGTIDTFVNFHVYSNASLSTAFDLSNCANIKSLRMHSTSADLDIGAHPALTNLQINNANVTGSFDISACPALITTYLNYNPITTFTHGVHPSMTIFEARGFNSLVGAHTLDITGWGSLTQVQIYDGKFTNFVLDNTTNAYPALTTLYLYDNLLNVGTLDFSGCPAIKWIWLYTGNTVTGITGLIATTLLQLRAQGIGLTGTVDISACTGLQYCHLNSNSISTFISGTHTALYDFEFRDNTTWTGTLDISTWTAIDNFQIQGSKPTYVTVGGTHNALETFNATSCNITVAGCNHIVDQVWAIRAVNADPTKFLYLAGNNGPLGATQLDKVNGTGAYVGDGLVDNGWSCTVP